MLIYEVNLKINTEIYAKYIAWLKNHIQEILSLPGFSKAVLIREQSQSSQPTINLTVQYYIDSQNNLDNYLVNHAPQMRADGLAQFPNKFSATRRIFEIDEIFISK